MKNTKLRRVGLIGGTAALALTAGTALAAAPANAATTSVWDKVAACESGGDWSINTGNGYYGGLQFSASTWKAYGGTGLASDASKAQQIAVAKKVLAAQGPSAWPVCSGEAGLTASNGGSASSSDSTDSTTSDSSSSSADTTTTTSTSGSSTTGSSTSGSSTGKATTTTSATSAQRTPQRAAQQSPAAAQHKAPTAKKAPLAKKAPGKHCAPKQRPDAGKKPLPPRTGSAHAVQHAG